LGPFYEDNPEPGLRFGDVVTGFQVATPQTHNPSTQVHADWEIAVRRPAYLAVVTPCCSIERKSIAVSPLLEVRPAFLKNEYFKKDLTNINRKVAPENSIPRDAWEKLPFEQKQSYMAKGHMFVFIDCFVYDASDLLPKYQLDRKGDPIEMGHYMVDFKSICRIDCKLIDRNKAAPRGTKILQLTVQTRQELRG